MADFNERVRAKCSDCDEQYSGEMWDAEVWADQHEADWDLEHNVTIKPVRSRHE